MLSQIAPLGVFLAFVIFWVWSFLHLGKKEEEPRKLLLLAFGAGILSTGVAGIFDSLVEFVFIVPRHGLQFYLEAEDTLELIGSLPLFMLLVGIFEEVAKFLSIRLTIFRSRFFDEIQDGLLYFGIAGLGFSLTENALYLLGFGTEIGLTRIIFFTPFHPATAAIVGYFAARQKIKGEKPTKTILALLVMIVIHGVHNLLTLNPTDLTIPLSVGIILFLYGELYFLWKHAKEEQASLTPEPVNPIDSTQPQV